MHPLAAEEVLAQCSCIHFADSVLAATSKCSSQYGQRTVYKHMTVLQAGEPETVHKASSKEYCHPYAAQGGSFPKEWSLQHK
jgi:hypothetical protein